MKAFFHLFSESGVETMDFESEKQNESLLISKSFVPPCFWSAGWPWESMEALRNNWSFGVWMAERIISRIYFVALDVTIWKFNEFSNKFHQKTVKFSFICEFFFRLKRLASSLTARPEIIHPDRGRNHSAQKKESVMSDSQNKLMEPEFNLSGFVDYRKNVPQTSKTTCRSIITSTYLNY